MTSTQALNHIIEPLLEIYDPGESVSIASIVLEDAFGIHPSQISKEIRLSNDQITALNAIIKRLLADEPVQYVMGLGMFYGLRFKVTPAVLIPRQETEECVHWVLETAKANPAVRTVLDIGTGSGCIPITIKKKRPDLEVHSLDVSTTALEIARENAAFHNVEVHFRQLDILDEKVWETLPMFDLIVSNPPYITEDERPILPKNVINFEPHLALFSGTNDAQRFVKKIADFGRTHLNPGGWVFLETNEFHVPRSTNILTEKGYEAVQTKKDLNKKDRMIGGRRGF